MIELITLATTAYLAFLGLMYLISKKIINWEKIEVILPYLKVSDYILVFVILIILSVLIAYRYGRKIFKDSVIKNYGERV